MQDWQANTYSKNMENYKKNLGDAISKIFARLTLEELEILQKAQADFDDRMTNYFCEVSKHDCADCPVKNLCDLMEGISYLLN